MLSKLLRFAFRFMVHITMPNWYPNLLSRLRNSRRSLPTPLINPLRRGRFGTYVAQSEYLCLCRIYICSEWGAVPLAQVHLTDICVDVLVWRVTPGEVEDHLDVYALVVGDN